MPQRGKTSIFDLNNKNVATIFNEKQTYKDTITNYKTFHGYFPMPEILDYDDEEMIIIEELVKHKANYENNNADYSYVVEDIFKKTINYLSMVSKEFRFLSKTPMELLNELPKNDKIVGYIWNNIDAKIKELLFPFVKLHGDLRTLNVLVNTDDNVIKYIDFEHSNMLIFFYDVLKFMWSEFRTIKKTFYKKGFINGKYDRYFEKMFALFNLEFNEKYKIDYLNIFFLNYCKERWFYLSEKQRRCEFNLYKNFINSIN